MKALMIYETSKEVGMGKRHYLQAIKEGLQIKYKSQVTYIKVDDFADKDFKIREYDLIFVCIDFKRPELYDHIIWKVKGKYEKMIFLLDENDPISDDLKFILQKTFTNKFLFEFGPNNLKYIPLKKPFWNPKKKKVRRKIKNILVTFGGSDPSHFHNKFLDEYYGENFIEYRKLFHFHVVVGKLSDPDLIVGHNLSSYYNIPTKQMKELMEKCDLAICSGGNTLVELMTMGVPTIAMAHNQKELDNIDGFIPYCMYAYNPSDAFYELVKQITHPRQYYKWRKNVSKKMQEEFDGKGVFRLLEAIGI